MKPRLMSRRGLLALTAGAGAAITVGAAGWSRVAGASTGRVLATAGPLPRPFGVSLPVPPVARPVRSEHGTDFYEMEQREGRVEILPSRRTTVWGVRRRLPRPDVLRPFRSPHRGAGTQQPHGADRHASARRRHPA
ncbi:hypothetical protein GCM10020000_78440 [Streptomyces olivoverticillatus]